MGRIIKVENGKIVINKNSVRMNETKFITSKVDGKYIEVRDTAPDSEVANLVASLSSYSSNCVQNEAEALYTAGVTDNYMDVKNVVYHDDKIIKLKDLSQVSKDTHEVDKSEQEILDDLTESLGKFEFAKDCEYLMENLYKLSDYEAAFAANGFLYEVVFDPIDQAYCHFVTNVNKDFSIVLDDDTRAEYISEKGVWYVRFYSNVSIITEFKASVLPYMSSLRLSNMLGCGEAEMGALKTYTSILVNRDKFVCYLNSAVRKEDAIFAVPIKACPDGSLTIVDENNDLFEVLYENRTDNGSIYTAREFLTLDKYGKVMGSKVYDEAYRDTVCACLRKEVIQDVYTDTEETEDTISLHFYEDNYGNRRVKFVDDCFRLVDVTIEDLATSFEGYEGDELKDIFSVDFSDLTLTMLLNYLEVARIVQTPNHSGLYDKKKGKYSAAHILGQGMLAMIENKPLLNMVYDIDSFNSQVHDTGDKILILKNNQTQLLKDARFLEWLKLADSEKCDVLKKHIAKTVAVKLV